MRLFIAIQFEQNVLNALTDAQHVLRKRHFYGQYSIVENLHMTLAFIGEYDEPDKVLGAIEKVQYKPFDITLGGYIGHFGNLLWASLENNPELENYTKELRQMLAEGDIPFWKKKFIPHITLLRNAESKRGFSDIAVRKETMTVRRITLMRSDLLQNDEIYTKIGSIELV